MKSEAYLNGWHAHKDGIENTANDNPYLEATQQYSNNQWLSGWCGRFEAIKHDKSLELDMKTGF